MEHDNEAKALLERINVFQPPGEISSTTGSLPLGFLAGTCLVILYLWCMCGIYPRLNLISVALGKNLS